MADNEKTYVIRVRNEATAAINQVNQALSTVDKQMEQVGKAATTASKAVNGPSGLTHALHQAGLASGVVARTVSRNFVNMSSSAISAARTIGTHVGQISHKLKTVGTVATGAASATGAAFGLMGINANRFREQTLATLTTLTKNRTEAQKLFDTFSKFADVTPFDDQEVIAAGKALMTFGFDARRELTLVGDVASAMQVPLEQVVNTFAKLKNGQFDIAEMGPVGLSRESLEQFGVRFSKGTGEVENRERLLPAAREFFQGKFGGAMAGNSKGFDAATSTAESNLRRVAQQATAPMFEMLKTAALSFSAAMEGVMKRGNLIQSMQQVFGSIGNAIAMAAGQMENLAKWVEKVASRSNLIYFFGKLIGLVYAFGQLIDRFFGGNLSKAMNPDTVEDFFEAFWKGTVNAINGMFGIARVVQNFTSDVVPALVRVMQSFGPVVQVVLRVVKSEFEDLGDFISDVFTGTFLKAGIIIGNIANVVARVFSVIVNTVKDKVADLLGVLGKVFSLIPKVGKSIAAGLAAGAKFIMGSKKSPPAQGGLDILKGLFGDPEEDPIYKAYEAQRRRRMNARYFEDPERTKDPFKRIQGAWQGVQGAWKGLGDEWNGLGGAWKGMGNTRGPQDQFWSDFHTGISGAAKSGLFNVPGISMPAGAGGGGVPGMQLYGAGGGRRGASITTIPGVTAPAYPGMGGGGSVNVSIQSPPLAFMMRDPDFAAALSDFITMWAEQKQRAASMAPAF